MAMKGHKRGEYPSFDLTPPEWGYVAGIIDGEGCLHARLGVRGDLNLSLQVAQVNPALPEWLRSKFGGQVYWRASDGRRRAISKWLVTKSGATSILRQTVDMLVVKQEEARLFLQLADTADEFCGRGRPRTIEHIERRAGLIDQIAYLKRREYRGEEAS